MFKYSVSQVRKFLVGAVGFVLTVVSVILTVNADLIPTAWLPWIAVFVGVCASYGIFRVPNTPPGPVPPAERL